MRRGKMPMNDDEPVGWDVANVDHDDLRSASRVTIHGVYTDLLEHGHDDAAERLRFAQPSNRSLLARRLRAQYPDLDGDGK